MKRTTVLLALATILGGCAGPPALTIVSLLTNAASYAATEKSVTDHGLSLAAHRDCAMWRIFTEGTMCREPEPVILVAGLANDPQTDAAIEAGPLAQIPVQEEELPQLAGFAPGAADVETAQAQLAVSDVQEAAPAVKALKPAAARARKRECCYFVIASFNKEKDARNLLRRHHGLAPQVVTATVDGDRKYRVVVGPFSDRGRETARRRIESAGIARPWIMAASG